ncbi:WD repeat-containing protein 83 [Allomyces javanicus]|nr:WD repeat-containing protein 83 [Allomyces javanicus]
MSSIRIRKGAALRAHTGPVNALKLDQTGDYLLSGGADKTVRLWNLNEARPVRTFAGHGWDILDLDIAPGSASFTSCGGDKAVFLWDVPSARVVRRFTGHHQRINTVAFNADASVIASGSYDATVRLWDVKSSSRTPIQVLSEGKDSVTSVKIVEHLILTGSVDGKIRTYDVRNGAMTEDVVGQPITSVHLSGDRNCILASALDSTVRLFDVENGELLNSYKGHRNEQYRLTSCLDSTDAYVISGSEDGKLYVWDLVDANAVLADDAHKGAVMAVAAHPKGACIVSSGADGIVQMWTTEYP